MPTKTITPHKITNESDYACVLAVMLAGPLLVRVIFMRTFLSGLLIATLAVRLNVFSANAVRRSHRCKRNERAVQPPTHSFSACHSWRALAACRHISKSIRFATRRTLGCVPLKCERVVERAVVTQAVRLGGYANWDNAGSRYLNANNSVRNTNRNNGGSAQTLGNLKKRKHTEQVSPSRP